MKLTAKKAVELSIKLWTWCAETGKDKDEWPEWERNSGQYPEVQSDCFLCEYAEHGCVACSYFTQYGACINAGTSYDKWDHARIEIARRNFAQQFLNQLKKVLKDMEEK